jgi:hypothetical protein
MIKMPGMYRMRQSSMSCASCHGADGRGGTVRMMMNTFYALDIRYSTLTEAGHYDDHDHPAYSNIDLIRAITLGVNHGKLLPLTSISSDDIHSHSGNICFSKPFKEVIHIVRI